MAHVRIKPAVQQIEGHPYFRNNYNIYHSKSMVGRATAGGSAAELHCSCLHFFNYHYCLDPAAKPAYLMGAVIQMVMCIWALHSIPPLHTAALAVPTLCMHATACG
jgi:hypothetical protein